MRNAELIPLLTAEDERGNEQRKITRNISILPCGTQYCFQGFIPITAGRDSSMP